MNETMQRIARVIENVERVVVGKRQEIELSLVALFASGHVLLEDVPGVGKTMLVKAIARSLGADFKRIQFTPDLLPSDVTGVSIYNQKTQQFEFRSGPIMANVVLADEINRTSPKTQSALLEALEEGSVTIEGKSLVLSKPFFVMATQNPVEYAGTYPLPEAQLDRFLFRLQLGYPKPDEELDVLKRLEKQHPIQELSPVMETEEVIQLQEEIKDVFVEDNVKAYIVEIVNLTRKHQKVELGVSPRGSIAMMKAAQAYAMIQGRDYVIPDDIKTLAPFALSHRLILTAEAKMSGTDHEEIIHDVLQQAKVPVIRKELLT
ncbi:MoxR family ATPase [Halalkalibacterium halodurans]|uniref:AAA family ATPase n=1 Tax=Halalkalibacterium halodurans TaxID=86665 RepID=UPI0010686478|nr:MoxR family ATPase [Halalkalibacterium halodurans]MDY7221099.1 MoxR family ATPase [Halalkalibacterium halodurans]MDY7240338.1 MoxR family ATPase [Halalkalibacterium halodurans]MED4082492.1 MoxR family ATPase [Halalkalibacterium halodurans]MED4086098.1 MoxR family ATPase [Halalkalibacterium halodurans]MED4106983.1 MoxR family ATPase [Halalkalibacterium halodurans]